MEDRDVEQFLQSFLNFETRWRSDVFEVDAAKARGNALNGFNNFFGVSRVQSQGKRVDAREFFEQQRLAFHDWHCGFGADVA